MPLDPISYSLIKKKDYITGTSIIYSSTEPEDKTVIWFDTSVRKPKIYDNQSGKWGILKYAIGYSDFDNNLDGAWTNYISIPITTSPSESVQCKIEINGDNINVYSNDGADILVTGTGGLDFWGKVQTDGKDIRVFDETNSQNYFWVEEFDYINKKCIVWIKLNAGQEVINVAYGNNDCLASSYCNGNMTFEFFDDFNDGTIDDSKWTILSGNVDESNGYLTVKNGQIKSKVNISGNVVISVRMMNDKNSGYNAQQTIFFNASDDTITCRVYLSTIAGSIIITDQDITHHTTIPYNANTWYSIDCYIYDNTFKAFIDGTLQVSATTTNIGIPESYIVLSDENYNNEANYSHWDYIIIRKSLNNDLLFGAPTIKEF